MQKDHTNVVIFPPLIPITSFLVGIGLDRVAPLTSSLSETARSDLRTVGATVFCIGIAGFLWMVATMKRARTPIHNAKTPTALVETGPFRLSRNPMYVFGTVWYVGLALFLVELWPVLLVPVLLTVLHYTVVIREEAYLSRKFGAAYERYRSRVPRWL